MLEEKEAEIKQLTDITVDILELLLNSLDDHQVFLLGCAMNYNIAHSSLGETQYFPKVKMEDETRKLVEPLEEGYSELLRDSIFNLMIRRIVESLSQRERDSRRNARLAQR